MSLTRKLGIHLPRRLRELARRGPAPQAVPQPVERDEALLPPVPATLRERQERRRRRAGQHLALALALSGCAELPPAKSTGTSLAPGGGAGNLRIELAGEVDRDQALEALRREAARWATCAEPTVSISAVGSSTKPPKPDAEPVTTTTIIGSFGCPERTP